jgi:nitrogen PTS system EIIA component
MNIKNYINKDTVIFLSENDKCQCLKKMIDAAFKSGKISDKDIFTKAIEERESLISTGIGLGVAVPHAKLKMIPDFFIITAINSLPVYWDSIDGKPVKIIFLIGGPSDRQTDYLKLLSHIILTVKDEYKRKKIETAGDALSVTELFI